MKGIKTEVQSAVYVWGKTKPCIRLYNTEISIYSLNIMLKLVAYCVLVNFDGWREEAIFQTSLNKWSQNWELKGQKKRKTELQKAGSWGEPCSPTSWRETGQRRRGGKSLQFLSQKTSTAYYSYILRHSRNTQKGKKSTSHE